MTIANVSTSFVKGQCNHLRLKMREDLAALKMAHGEESPVLMNEPGQHGCRYIANDGALNSVGAAYNGVIRLALENRCTIPRD